jgi:hypothetical protein
LCWIGTATHRLVAPPGIFTSIALSYATNADQDWFESGCGIRADRTIGCWGDKETGLTTPLSGTFVSMSVAIDHACAIKTDGSVVCWGDNPRRDPELAVVPPPAGVFTQVLAGDTDCALRPSGRVECWGVFQQPEQ